MFSSVIASSGFWAFLQHRLNKNSSLTDLTLGLAHDRLLFLSKSYLHRGYITIDEYENLMLYLYEPYKACGGNGAIAKMIHNIGDLPIRDNDGKNKKGEKNEK